MNLFLQLLGNGLVQGAMALCLAAGFGFVYRSLRIFHIAMGGQFVFSCYAFYFFAVRLNWGFFWSGLTALVLSAAFGVLIELAVYRPFFKKNSSSGVMMIASLGVMIIVENLIALGFGNEVKTISNQLEPSAVLGGLRFTRIQLIQFFGGIAIFAGAGLLTGYVRYFKAVWAMGEQPELIPVLGLPQSLLRLTVMVLSSVMIAVPAILISWDIGMDPHVGMHYLLLASVAVFFGGTDRYLSWGIGTMVLAVLQSLAVWKFSARWTDLVTFGALVVILLFRPQGVFGTRKRLEEES
ncbi:MAG: branched-chain amino acid ABC transporter permease [Lentisphaerae bacterium]|nr:branched-chain amino acid ABC transporter permease [Lentisphaerota bacterium]